jgi:FtsP/CotA-like multicopper oxidase with cupredoxin domain
MLRIMRGDRRQVLLGAGALVATHAFARPVRHVGRADHVIHIGASLVELGQNKTISTTTYNGQFPGPLLRMTAGKRVTVDIHNDTDRPEQLHWHGQFIPAAVDGASEEGTPFIAPHSMRRVSFVPGPAGFRFYHSHLTARTDLSAGLYGGQAGLVFIDPQKHPGAYDREVFLTLKEFGPYLTRMEMPNDFLAPTATVPELRAMDQAATDASIKQGINPQGYELAYNFFSVNGRSLGEGEPLRVKRGERVLFHILNASATEIRSLALPGHRFNVIALDGFNVPHPAPVPVLWLGPAERISAIVEMTTSGVWVMGDTDDDSRSRGQGIVVEYAGAKGKPVWKAPPPFRWDYTLFGKNTPPRTPDETLTLLFTARPGAEEGFDQFAINGVPFSMERMEPMFHFRRGRRYRLKMRNATDDTHPIHLHRHAFELTNVAGESTSGVLKDVAMIGGFQEMSVDFTADQPGLSLFHCHMQDHMDFGFMALFSCA